MDSRNSGMFGSLTVCLVGGWGGLGWSEPAPIAVWMEMRRDGLASEENIPLRCGFDSSLKIWRTEPLQPGWLTSASPVALSVFSVRCARDSPRRPSPARRAAPSSSSPAAALSSPAARHRISRIAVWRPGAGRRIRQRGALGGGASTRGAAAELVVQRKKKKRRKSNLISLAGFLM